MDCALKKVIHSAPTELPNRVLTLLIQTIGWLVAHTPEWLLRGATVLLAEAALLLRRRLILSNLHHAFPEWSEAARRGIARASCRRMIETALLSLATPFIPLPRLRHIIRNTAAMDALVVAQQRAPRAQLLVTPHFAYWEAVTCFPIAIPNAQAGLQAEFAAIYRPLNTPALDVWLKATRERHGCRLLSRKKGFQEAISILRRGGAVSILFDQNAGDIGALSTLLGRVCSTTELPGLLAQKFAAPVVAVYARRLGFWRVEVEAEPVLPASETASSEAITLALNRWLEAKLRSDANARASWLWAHARWKNQSAPDRRLRLSAKRNLLAADLAARAAVEQPLGEAFARLPKSTRVWLRLPNWLGDVVMLIPLLLALRQSRPDAQLTLIGKAAFAPLIEEHALADRFIALPPRGLGYFAKFWQLRRCYPDCYLLFTNSARGDIEAWLSRAPQRFGIARPGKWRPLLTHRYALPPSYDETQHHQLELWHDFLRHFGLEQTPDLRPLRRVESADAHAPQPQHAETHAEATPGGEAARATATAPLGLIVGSENAPEKRWPVAHWVALIHALPSAQPIVLFGTAKDRELSSEIVARCCATAPQHQLENLAGQTDLRQYCARLRSCAALVSNDTGGMHLANALGVPLVALFGPTNPVRTGPIFATPAHILQPPGCPRTGGGTLAALAPEQVLAALQPLLPSLTAAAAPSHASSPTS